MRKHPIAPILLGLGALALAACDTDRPLGPNPKTIPTEASAAKGIQTLRA